MGLLDNIKDGIGKVGTATAQMLEETKMQMDIMRERRRKDAIARDLGYLVYRESQGASASAGEREALTGKIAEIEKEIARLEAEARNIRTKPRNDKPEPQPPPSPAAP